MAIESLSSFTIQYVLFLRGNPTHRYVSRGSQKEVGEDWEESRIKTIYRSNRHQQSISQACGGKRVNALKFTTNIILFDLDCSDNKCNFTL